MRLPFAVTLALREARGSLPRLGAYTASITLGVAALVALHSFRSDVSSSIESQAKVLLGSDIRLSTSSPFGNQARSLLDSLSEQGVGVAEVTVLGSMVRNGANESVRLLQVTGVEGEYPFYGIPRSTPAGLWNALGEEAFALVDPAVLIQLDASVGDTVLIGSLALPIRGTVEGLPSEVGLQAAIGPRVFISAEALKATELLGFGSLVRYRAAIRLPEEAERVEVRDRYEGALRDERVSLTTAEQQARNLTATVDALGRFLGLIGLAALLLGGIGVGSAIHVYVREKRISVAVLRCLGARQRTLFMTYVLQAGALGVMGAGVGVVLGVSAQRVLPFLLRGLFPVEITTTLAWPAVAAGFGVGVWVAIIFALDPLLEVRHVSPLAALRHDFEGTPMRGRRDRALVGLGVMVSILLLSYLEASGWREGLAFTVALGGILVALAAAGGAVIHMTRRLFPKGASFTVRQGVGNLFRPQNQTVAVTIALGFGAFVIGTVTQVQKNLMQEFSIAEGVGAANLLLFDVQPSQRTSVMDLVEDWTGAQPTVDAVVPARLSAINGVLRAELLETPPDSRPQRWAVRREYRHTYRDRPTTAEEVIEGSWWEAGSGAIPGVARISLERDLADALKVTLGDRITWDVGGVAVESEITSLRTVDWTRFETNFFVVFEPGFLEEAPQSGVILTHVADDLDRARLQRELVTRHPNVSAFDLARIQGVVAGIVARFNQGVRFLGAFATVAGVLVLIGAMSVTRFQRMREGALLKTLGAQRALVLRIIAVEYAALATIATGTGLLLAGGASWLLIQFAFDLPFQLYPVQLLLVWLFVIGVTVVTGLLGNAPALRKAPLVVLREITG